MTVSISFTLYQRYLKINVDGGWMVDSKINRSILNLSPTYLIRFSMLIGPSLIWVNRACSSAMEAPTGLWAELPLTCTWAPVVSESVEGETRPWYRRCTNGTLDIRLFSGAGQHWRARVTWLTVAVHSVIGGVKAEVSRVVLTPVRIQVAGETLRGGWTATDQEPDQQTCDSCLCDYSRFVQTKGYNKLLILNNTFQYIKKRR